MRASVSRTDASAISECGPPAWNAESVSVKLHHMKRGAGYETPRYSPLQMPTACSTRHVVDDARPRVVLRRAHEALGDVGEAVGRGRHRRDVAAPEEVERRVVGADVARLVDRRGARVGPRAVDRVVQRLDAVEQVLHRPRPGGLRVRDHLLAALAVPPRVVQDAVVAGVAPGEDRRVVRERDRRHAGDRAPLVRRAHLDQPGDVRRRAGRGERVEHVRVRAVEQEADDVTRASAVGVDHVGARPRRPGRRDTCPSSRGATPRSSAIVGATSTRRAARGTRPSLRTPLPAITNGARACTTPSDPCSPRWPPWSSQLCAAEWMTQRSGAEGWSKSWAVCSNANG